MTPLSQPLERPAQEITEALAKFCHWFCFSLFALSLVLDAVSLAFPQLLPQSAVVGIESFLVLFATATTLCTLARQLPAQNIFAAATIIAVIGTAATTIGLKTAIPFGPFIFSDELQPQVKGVPWLVPFIWVIAVFNSRGVARLILRPWRKTRTYGWWVIGFAIVLCLMLDLGWEVFFGPLKHYVLWTQTKFPLSWYGVPISNSLGWIITLLLMLAFSTPFLINKRHTRSTPDYFPLIVWLSLNVLFAIGAAKNQMWSSVIVTGIGSVITTVFAIRGALW